VDWCLHVAHAYWLEAGADWLEHAELIEREHRLWMARRTGELIEQLLAVDGVGCHAARQRHRRGKRTVRIEIRVREESHGFGVHRVLLILAVAGQIAGADRRREAGERSVELGARRTY